MAVVVPERVDGEVSSAAEGCGVGTVDAEMGF